jgi:hypothetical protein
MRVAVPQNAPVPRETQPNPAALMQINNLDQVMALED